MIRYQKSTRARRNVFGAGNRNTKTGSDRYEKQQPQREVGKNVDDVQSSRESQDANRAYDCICLPVELIVQQRKQTRRKNNAQHIEEIVGRNHPSFLLLGRPILQERIQRNKEYPA